MKETIGVLRATGHKIVPRVGYAVSIVPTFLLVPILMKFLATKLAEVGAAYHASQAPDEMEELARGLKKLVVESRVTAPNLQSMLSGIV
jgi:hypothetical protein